MAGVWSAQDVSYWLVRIGFEKLSASFLEQAVDGEVLLSLTLDELKEEFKMNLGDRKKLYERIRSLKEETETTDAGRSDGDTRPQGKGTYLLDGRNIACEGEGDSFEHPNLGKLMTTLEWLEVNRPEWDVLTFVYKGLVDEWRKTHPAEMARLEQRLTPTPRREDVDKFLLRGALEAQRRGAVRVVSNDNFREYLNTVEDYQLDENWVREHVVKFCFTPEGTFIPADGIGVATPQPVRPACTAPAPTPAPAPAPVLPGAALDGPVALLTGRGAKFPCTLKLADAMQEARCPQKRCPLRLAIRGRRIGVLGVETPAARARAPLELALNRRSWCPTCGRPLELRPEGGTGGTGGGGRARRRGCAWVAVLFGPDEAQLRRFVLGALVLGHSLKETRTKHELVLLHTQEVLAVPGAGLLEQFWQMREVDYVEAHEQLMRHSEERFKHVFTKLQVLGCDDFEKVVLLDLDLLVRANIDELSSFRAPAALRRGHKALPQGLDVSLSFVNGKGEQRYGVNLGVALLKPCGKELERMLEVVRSSDATHQASNGPEQDFLSRWYKDWSSLDLKYNYQLHQLAYSLKSVGPQADRILLRIQDVKVFHYSGGVKPWDIYFQETKPESFQQFLDESLLPAYCPTNEMEGDEAVQEKIRTAAQEWQDSCMAMWDKVLQVPVGSCPLCDAQLSDAAAARRHAFAECPAIADLSPAALDAPSAEGLDFVGSVWERRRWCQSETSAKPEAAAAGVTEVRRVEEVATPLRNPASSEGEGAPAVAAAVPTVPPAMKSEPKVLHLVLQPVKSRRSYEDTPLNLYKEVILESVADNRVTIIVAPTGCGKSTGIPQMLLDESLENQVLVTQPRRVAATSLARRVSEQRGGAVGEEVGFKIGGCSEVSRSGRTRLVFATTAIAMTQCLQECATFTHLLIDEVHIRDAHIDFLLSLVVTRVLVTNHAVKVILMSAAMDSDKIAKYFAQVVGPVPRPLDLEGCRQHRQDIWYLDDLDFFLRKGLIRGHSGEWYGRRPGMQGVPAEWSQEEVAELYADFLKECHQTRKELSSFLVFLPGKRELALLAERLDEVPDLQLRCIYGGQTVEEQERILAQSDSRHRTVILGTDVIESSVTIPDVDLVIDTCEQKRLRWDSTKKQSLLTLVMVSQDEAKQRSGRTGRVRDGEVMRLITKDCFNQLKPHVEPQIKHSRLEDLLLSIFELPNLGDPREFLQRLPDPPAPDRVDRAITRLLELNALAKTEGSAKPTYFGRFLQKMPLDPDVGLLVMSGVRLNVVKECAILAAVHTRGSPFVDSMDLGVMEVKHLWEVRDVCSPRAGHVHRLAGDLVAGLGAYEAWQKQMKYKQWWSIQQEAEWCAQHYLSLERLLELEEMVLQIHDVLEGLGYAPGLKTEEKERMRQRRQQKLYGTLKSVSGRANAAENLQELLGIRSSEQDRQRELLLAWCLAAAFTGGIVEVLNGSSTEQLKYTVKKHKNGDRAHEIEPSLRRQELRLRQVRKLQKGDVEVTFQSREEAHKAYQRVQLLNNSTMPWRSADLWGRPNQRTQVVPRQCYQGAQVRILPSSSAWPPTSEDAVLVAGEVLGIMNHKRTSMSYLCTKCSTVPAGIVPFIFCATYPAAELSKEVTTWSVKTQIYGMTEEVEYTAPAPEIGTMLESIRNSMDAEFGREKHLRQRIVEERRKHVLALMRSLDQSSRPSMRRTHPVAAATRGGARGLDFDVEVSALVDLMTNRLSNFVL